MGGTLADELVPLEPVPSGWSCGMLSVPGAASLTVRVPPEFGTSMMNMPVSFLVMTGSAWPVTSNSLTT